MYTVKDMEIMTENATLKERCTQLQKRIDMYEIVIAALSKDKAAVPPIINPNPYGQGCHVCGMGADGKSMGYVCYRVDCPTRVTC